MPSKIVCLLAVQTSRLIITKPTKWRMPRLIWVFAGRTVILLVLSWGGSNVLYIYIYAGTFNCFVMYVTKVIKRPMMAASYLMDCVKRIWYLSPMRAAKVQASCASAQSRKNLRCSLMQAVSQEEPSDRKPDPWPLWMAGHAQLKFVITECSKTHFRLTGLIWYYIYICFFFINSY